MDPARRIYLANERQRQEREAARRTQREASKEKPLVITDEMRQGAKEHAAFIENTLPPRDRE